MPRIKRTIPVVGTNINWQEADGFTDSVNATKTYTFSGVEPRVIVVSVRNTSGAPQVVNFPTARWSSASPVTIVLNGQTNTYTFVSVGGNIFASVIVDLVAV